MNNFSVMVLIFVLFPGSTWAFGGGGKGEIDYIFQRSSDGLLAVYKVGGNWNNPDGCDSSVKLVLTKDNPSRNEFYSAILASKISGLQFEAYLSGCVNWNGETFPQIIGVYTY